MAEAPEIRISDTERERALRELIAHFSAGRLTLPEFDNRSAAAYAASTRTELAELFVDLPGAVPSNEYTNERARSRYVVGATAVTIFAIGAAIAFHSWIPMLIAAVFVPSLIVSARYL